MKTQDDNDQDNISHSIVEVDICMHYGGVRSKFFEGARICPFSEEKNRLPCYLHGEELQATIHINGEERFGLFKRCRAESYTYHARLERSR